MNKIVTTSLLIAAGITISACNVTTGTGKSTAYQFESDSDRRIAAASQADVTGTAATTSDRTGSAGTQGGDQSLASASSGGSGRSTGQPGGTSGADTAQSGQAAGPGEVVSFDAVEAITHMPDGKNAAKTPSSGTFAWEWVPAKSDDNS